MDNQPNPFGNAPTPEQTPTPTQPATTPPTVPVVQSSAPISPAAPVSPAAPKKSKKGLIIGLSIGGALLVIAGVILTLLLVLGGVSKADYEEAQKSTQSLASEMSEISSTITDLSNSSDSSNVTELSTELKNLKSKLAEYVKELGDQKAIKQDEEAAKKYETMKSAQSKVDKNIDTMIEVSEEVLPVFIDIQESMSGFSSISSLSQIQSLITEFRRIETKVKAIETSNSTINQSMADIGSDIGAMADLFETALTSNSTSGLMTGLYSLQSSLSSSTTKFSNEMKNLSDNKDFTNAANDLDEYLTDKVNEK
jgi:outer membrane murein-binding lipoprotein Lpp